jgi:hypothetical protein
MSAGVFAVSAKVIPLTAPTPKKRPSNRKKNPPLPEKWERVFWDEIVPFGAFRNLTPMERSLLIDLFHTARRIGTDVPIGCSARNAADILGMGRTSGFAALAGLEEKGFLISVVRSRSDKRERVASNWRIAFLPFQGMPPRRDYVRRYYKSKDMEAHGQTSRFR